MNTLNNIFLGFKQVTSESFAGVTDKKGYFWLVREVVDGEFTGKADIWFGNRHYGSFDPSVQSEILAIKETITNILENENTNVSTEVFETKVNELISLISEKVDVETYESKVNELEVSLGTKVSRDEFDGKVAELEKVIIDNEEIVSTALNDLQDRKADINDVVLKSEYNPIEKVTLFGNEVPVTDKTVSLDFQADDIKLGTAIGDMFPADKTIHETLKSIYESFSGPTGGSGIVDLNASDDSVLVEGDATIKNVKVQVSAAADNKLVVRTVEGEKGLYVKPLYYEGDDVEVE
jgi:hypothetical protein